MKKIVSLFALFLTLSIGIYHAYSTKTLSELQLANIEALANGETGTSIQDQEKKKNAMEVGIKWYVVALILNRAKIAIASSTSLIMVGNANQELAF